MLITIKINYLEDIPLLCMLGEGGVVGLILLSCVLVFISPLKCESNFIGDSDVEAVNKTDIILGKLVSPSKQIVLYT